MSAGGRGGDARRSFGAWKDQGVRARNGRRSGVPSRWSGSSSAWPRRGAAPCSVARRITPGSRRSRERKAVASRSISAHGSVSPVRSCVRTSLRGGTSDLRAECSRSLRGRRHPCADTRRRGSRPGGVATGRWSRGRRRSRCTGSGRSRTRSSPSPTSWSGRARRGDGGREGRHCRSGVHASCLRPCRAGRSSRGCRWWRSMRPSSRASGSSIPTSSRPSEDWRGSTVGGRRHTKTPSTSLRRSEGASGSQASWGKASRVG